MKTTVVPAQITTVEDKIAGSLSFPQIFLMVISLVTGATIYGMIGPKLHLSSFKMTLIIIQFVIFGMLALRFNGKILLDWLIIYLRYKVRPRRYIFTKNDLIHRDIILPNEETVSTPAKEQTEEIVTKTKSISLREQIKIDRIFDNETLSISFKLSRKGGVDVALKQIEN